MQNIIESLLQQAETDPAYHEWQKSPEGIAAAERTKGKSREELNAEILDLLEKLGLIAPESSTGEGASP